MPIVPSWVVLVKSLGKKKRLCRKQVGGKGLRWARSEGARGLHAYRTQLCRSNQVFENR